MSDFSDFEEHFGIKNEMIALHQEETMSWEDAKAKIPDLPRGWYELSRLSGADRIEFSREYWLSQLPYSPHAHKAISKFFENINSVGVFASQRLGTKELQAELSYACQDHQAFYHGFPPLDASQVQAFHGPGGDNPFPAPLPEDYLAFLCVHNGFSKSTDTGLIPLHDLQAHYQQLQEFLQTQEPIIISDFPMNPKSLIPFYESFGLHAYQCFWSDWYPGPEMGNVYYSGIENCLSDVSDKEKLTDQMAFSNFLDWLLFYLEKIA